MINEITKQAKNALRNWLMAYDHDNLRNKVLVIYRDKRFEILQGLTKQDAFIIKPEKGPNIPITYRSLISTGRNMNRLLDDWIYQNRSDEKYEIKRKIAEGMLKKNIQYFTEYPNRMIMLKSEIYGDLWQVVTESIELEFWVVGSDMIIEKIIFIDEKYGVQAVKKMQKLLSGKP